MSFGFGTAGSTSFGGGFGAPAASAGFGATSQPGASASPFGGGAANTGFGTTSSFGAAGGATSAFGAKPATTGFGGGFGGNATGFGAQPAAGGGFGTTGFGTTGATSTGFGAQPAASGGFGTTTTATTGFGATGGFGATSGGFGTTNSFGATAAASPFGKPAANPSPFGQSSVFGGTGTTTGGFGTTSSFGAPATPGGSMFGATTGATGAFGAKSPFQTGAAAPGAFGAAAAPAGGFGNAGFGAPTQPQVGTGNPPYQSTRESDGTGQSNFISISKMPPYAHKSAEELRYEDYLKKTNPAAAQAAASLNAPAANVGVASGGFGTTTSGFGTTATQPAAGGFGTMGGGFGTTTTGSFGAPAASTGGFGSFGATSTAPTTTSSFGFGNQQQASGGMFGAANRSSFGSPTTSQPLGSTTGFGGFGATTTPAAGGFGTTPAAGFGAGGFGAAAQPQQGQTSGFGFGAGATGATTGGFGAGGFGKPATTGGFGFGGTTTTTAAPAAGGFGFGAPAQPAGAAPLFGSTGTPTTGSSFSFGAKPATASSAGFGFGASGGFGAGTSSFTATSAAPTGLFGGSTATNAAPGAGGFSFGGGAATQSTGLFGGSKPSLFGATPATTTSTGGLFGSTAGAGSSLFGNTGASAAKPAGFGFGTTTASPGGFGGFGSFGATTTPSTGLGGGMFGQPQTAAQGTAGGVPVQPSTLVAAPDVNPYGAGSFGAGLVEQNVKAALDEQSLKPTSTFASRISSFSQDVGLPRGPLEAPAATRRNLLGTPNTLPVSFIGNLSFKGTKSRLSSSASESSESHGGKSEEGSEDSFKFSSSLFPNSATKRLIINKGESKSDAGVGSRATTTRASVIPLSDEDVGASSVRDKPLQPDNDGKYVVKFRNLATKKTFSLRFERGASMNEVRKEVKHVLQSTMGNDVADIKLICRGRILQEAGNIEDAHMKEDEVVDVGIEEQDRDNSTAAGRRSSSASETLASKPSRFMTYAEFMSSAIHEEDEQANEVLSKPVSAACPSLKNDEYYTVPTYERLKRMSERELSEVDGFTVGCKGLGSVEWIGKTDVRHLDLDDLVSFEKKEVIVYKDDSAKHAVGEGLNKPAIVELLGIFPPRKSQNDPEKYKERVRQRTKDIGATYLDYSPTQGIWRFRVEHFSRYGFDDDDDDDDVDMEASAASAASLHESKKKMTLPPPMQHHLQDGLHSFMKPSVPNDKRDLVRKSVMFGRDYASTQNAVALFDSKMPAGKGEQGMEYSPMEDNADEEDDEEEDEDVISAPPVVPTSIVFDMPDMSILPLGVDAETAVLPRSDKSPTYQMFLHVTSQSTAVPEVVVKNHKDTGFFLARSFRCSWGPNGELVNLGRLITTHHQPDARRQGKTVSIEFPLKLHQVDLTVTRDALQMHYDCAATVKGAVQSTSVNNVEDSGAITEFALPSGDGVVSCLHKYADAATKLRQQHPNSTLYREWALVWSLVQALWGQEHDAADYSDSRYCPLAAHDDPSGMDSMESSQMMDLRREAISLWFESALQKNAIPPLCDSNTPQPSHEGILKLLCQHRVVEASEMAMECNDFNLATLIAQSAAFEGSDFRPLVVDQLAQWSENGTLEYVDETLVLIYSLLAGSVEVVTAQKSSGLTWIACLALFFWFKRGPATPLQTSLKMYSEAVGKHLAASPSARTLTESQVKLDVLMEVMKLYVEDAVSLCSVLSPSGFLDDRDCHLDYELSWHMHSVLRAIGFKIDRKWESHLHQNFIRHLESAGLWEEALYVSLNVSDATEREQSCRQLLYRNADMLQNDSDKRAALCDRFQLPVEWVEEALATAAVSKHAFHEEIAHWIAAGCYDDAHRCLIRHVAPQCLFAGEKDVLLQLLADLEPFAMQISQWDACGVDYVIGGGLLLEYLRLQRQDGLEAGREEEFLARLLRLSEILSQTSGSISSNTPDREVVVARTAVASMLVALTTQAVQLRILLKESMVEQDELAVPPQLQPEFLGDLASLLHGREDRFVENFRNAQGRRLCAAFVEWRA